MPLLPRAIAFLAALAVLPASAAEITTTKEPDGSSVIFVSGPIVRSDIDKAWDAIEGAAKVRPPLVVLNSPGGDLDAGMSIARAVAKAKARSTVPVNGMCASVCFLAWAAGADRTAEPGARIGVHTAADSKIETDTARAYTLDMARAANLYGVPLHIIGRMVVTKNYGMHWLDAREIRSMTGAQP